MATTLNLIGIVALLIACQPHRTEPPITREKLADRSIALRGPSAEYVRVEAAKRAEGTHDLSLPGHVAFDDRKVARMGPPVQGRVSAVAVVVGDPVKKGDLLVTVNAPEIAASSAQVAETHTARILAQRNAERARLLVEKGAGSEADALQAEAALAQAKSEEERASAALGALGGTHGSNNYQLRAPIDGIVVERNVAVGTEVHTDQDAPLLTLADLSTVWVLADVYEQDIGRLHAGDTAHIDVVAFPERHFQGTITEIGHTVDPQTRVATARIEIWNPDLALRPGMSAAVRAPGLALGVADVPLSAVLARRDQFFTFVKNRNGTFSQREVKLGEQHGEHVSVLSGISPGDPVVTQGAILLDAEANETL